ncbi:MAG: hypothetical protein AAF514_14990, partial [Verrucomicrobiota bacterium]
KFACIKHFWALEKRIEALNALESCRFEFLECAGISFDGQNSWDFSKSVPEGHEKRVLVGTARPI